MTAREKELTEQLAKCQSSLAETQRENALLRQKIDLLVRRVFGASSEALDTAQLELLMGCPLRPPLLTLRRFNPSPKSLLFVRAKIARHACLKTCRWSKK